MARKKDELHDDLKKDRRRKKTPKQYRSKRNGSKAEVVENALVKDEEIIIEARIHWAIYLKAIIVFVFSSIVGMMILELGALLFAAAVLMAIHATISREIFMLVLTNKRVFVRYGLLQVDVVDIRFSKIESIELERMIPGYLLGYANVVIMGTGQRYVVIPFVGNATAFRRAYNKVTLDDEELLEEGE
ncbi:MAG: hypothetical protein CBB87_11135 [Micavibrio sp. TMED27]|nr:hypothetical protein [Micavibrio sp.]OUT89847.1 MAG: hypothetical protein CBB87_11135 [Micavibrio sp. TMED27]|tara:strand:+ start:2197 stop:2760 length:564 start_codon:yes stop_codon:yes gene_type:complete